MMSDSGESYWMTMNTRPPGSSYVDVNVSAVFKQWKGEIQSEHSGSSAEFSVIINSLILHALTLLPSPYNKYA